MNETVWKTLAKSGPWAVVAGVLIGVFVFDVRVGITEGRGQHEHLIQSVDAVKNIAGQSDMAMQKVLAVLLASCINNARNEEQRNRCLGEIDTRTR